jgi:hypothetical protein
VMMEAPERLKRASADGEADTDRQMAEHINDLLSKWHAWSAGQLPVHGFPPVNATCRQSRTSRQYDDQNGGLDAHIDQVLMEAVDSVIDAIPQPWRTALSFQARNLHQNASVWSSPRLPSCAGQRTELVIAARKRFADLLASRNLI